MPQKNLQSLAMVFVFLATAVACGRGVLHTGVAGTTPAPSIPVAVHPDDTCDPGLTVCPGPGAGYCFDLRASPEHCGSCGQACALGSPCENGQCRVVRCTSQVSVMSLRTDNQGAASNQPTLLDCDRDGALDMIAVFPSGLGTSGSSPEGMRQGGAVYHGNSDGTFVPGESYRVQSFGYLVQLLAADLNRDQIADIIMLGHPAAPSKPEDVEVVVRLGKGDCTFGPEIGLDAGILPTSMALRDLDGDAIPDLVVSAENGQQVRTFHGNGDGSFSKLQDLAVTSGLPSTLVVAIDWNSDGILDLVVAEEYLHLLLGIGNGQFAPAIDCAVRLGDLFSNQHHVPAVIADFDQDGAVDLATKNTILFGMHECNHTRLATFPAQDDSALPLLAGDFNGDGALDLVLETGEGIGFLPGNGRGDFGDIVMLGGFDKQEGRVGSPGNTFVFAGDFNGDGRLDLTVANEVSIRIFINTCQ